MVTITTSTYNYGQDKSMPKTYGVMVFRNEHRGYVHVFDVSYEEYAEWGIWCFTLTESEYKELVERSGIGNLAMHIQGNALFIDNGWSTCSFSTLEGVLEEIVEEDVKGAVRTALGALKVIAYQLPAERRVDEWDGWSSDMASGWYILGNKSLIPHGVNDPEWLTLKEIGENLDWRDALACISENINSTYIQDEKKQRVLQDIVRALVGGDKPWENCHDPFIARIVESVYRYSKSQIGLDDFAVDMLSFIWDKEYASREIHGSVQGEWQRAFYPVAEEADVDYIEATYFGLYEQFEVTDKSGEKTIVTAYGNTEDDWKEAICGQIDCHPEDIELYMISGSHMEYDYERR